MKKTYFNGTNTRFMPTKCSHTETGCNIPYSDVTVVASSNNIVTVAMKVNASYLTIGLGKYSEWMHPFSTPDSDTLVRSSCAEIIATITKLRLQEQKNR